MLRAPRDADRIGPPECRRNRLPPDGCASQYEAFGIVVVDVCGNRYLPRRHQLPDQRMPAANLWLGGSELAEEREAPLLAHLLHRRAEPVDVARLDPDLAREPGMQQIVIRGGHLSRLHQARVVSNREEVEPV